MDAGSRCHAGRAPLRSDKQNIPDRLNFGAGTAEAAGFGKCVQRSRLHRRRTLDEIHVAAQTAADPGTRNNFFSVDARDRARVVGERYLEAALGPPATCGDCPVWRP